MYAAFVRGSPGSTKNLAGVITSFTGFFARSLDSFAKRLSQIRESADSSSSTTCAFPVGVLINLGSSPLRISLSVNVPRRLYFSSNTRIARGSGYFLALIKDTLIILIAWSIENQYGMCGYSKIPTITSFILLSVGIPYLLQ